MENDEEYPPEISKTEKEFLFQEINGFSLLDENFRSDKRRLNLLTFSNTYGYVVVASKNGFKGYKSSDLLKAQSKDELQVVFDVALQSSPCWISLSNDNLTLVVCCSGERGLQALFFDTRSLINTSKSTKMPFADIDLVPNSSEDFVSDLHWNPSKETGKFLAICMSNGAFLMLAVEDTVQVHAEKPKEFGATAACWSRKGKQVMIGKSNGSLEQYTPAMELKRSVPPWEHCNRKCRVSDVLWLSTFQVAVTYLTQPTDSESSNEYDSPNLLIVQLPSSKEPNKKPEWQFYEDPNYGVGSSRLPRSFLNLVEKWNLFVSLTSTSDEICMLVKNQKSNKWELWSLDDNCQARVPYGNGGEDVPFVIGSGVILTDTKNIRLNERDYGAMPALAFLSCDGMIALFQMIGRESTEIFPAITQPVSELSLTGERIAKASTKLPLTASSGLGSGSGGGGGENPTLSKPKLTAKPSMRIVQFPAPATSSTFFKVIPEANKNMPSALAAVSEASAFALLSRPVPTSSNENVSKPAPVAPIPTAQAVPKVNETKPLATIPVPTTTSKSMFSAPVTSTAVPTSTPLSLSLPKPVAVVPTPPLPKSVPAPVAVTSTVNDNKSETTAPAVITTTSGKLSSLLGADVAREVEEFQRELANFRVSCDITKQLDSLGTTKMKNEHTNSVNELNSFKREIATTTKEQHQDIDDLSSVCLEAFASLQDFQKHRERAKNTKYRHALLSRPLDLNDQKVMKGIRRSYQYVKDAVRDTDAALNDQWSTFMNKNQPSKHKSRKQLEQEERDQVDRAIVNQTRILHSQETKLTLLSQQLDRLRLERTAGWRLSTTDIYSEYDKEMSDLNSKISKIQMGKKKKRWSGGEENKQDRDAEDQEKHNKQQQTRKRSALRDDESFVLNSSKASELKNWLSSRTRTPIRTTVRKYGSGGNQTSMMSAFSINTTKQRSSSPIAAHHPPTTTTTTSNTNADSSEHQSTISPDSPSVVSSSSSSSSSSSPSCKPDEASNEKLIPATATAAVLNLNATPSPSKSLIGSSTITYGAPDVMVKHQTPSSMYDASVTQHKEAESNLNNPPLVVNIKEFKEPQKPLNLARFSPKFKPTSGVPLGAAQEVQKVLNTVVAEQSQPVSLPPSLQKDDKGAIGSSVVTSSSKPVALASLLASSSSSSVASKPSFTSSGAFSATDSTKSTSAAASSSAFTGFSLSTTAQSSSASLIPPKLEPGATQPIKSELPGSSLFKSSSKISLAGGAESRASTPPVQRNLFGGDSKPEQPAAALLSTLGDRDTPVSEKSTESPAVVSTGSEKDSVSGGLFGTTTAAAATSAIGKSLFGATSATGTSTGLFGSSSNNAVSSSSSSDVFATPAASLTSAASGGELFATPASSLTSLAATSAPTTTAPASASSDVATPAPATTAATPASTSLFGGGKDASASAAAAALFGAPAAAASTSSTSNLFGNSGAASPSSANAAADLFGSSSATSTVATTGGGGGLFGSTTSATTNAGVSSLFGSSTASTTTAASGLSAFGAAAPASTTPATAVSSTTSAAASASAGTSLFGVAPSVTPATDASSNLFGAAPTPVATTTLAAATTGLFGAATVTTAPAAAATGLFGSSTTAAVTAATTSLFGSGSAPSTAATSLFGSASSAAPATTDPAAGLFGTPAATSSGVFGSSTTASGGLFGSGTASTTATTGGPFGSSTPSTGGGLFGPAAPAGGECASDDMGMAADSSDAGGSGLFGTQAPAQPNTGGAFSASSSLFGPAPTNTGGGFGSTGGGFLSGLGGSNQQQQQNANPFASQQQNPMAAAGGGGSGESKSLFGAAATTPFLAKPTFSSTGGSFSSGQTPAFGATPAANTGGFGSPSTFGAKPASGGFGAAPVFGSSPLAASPGGFGSKPVFGSSALSPAFGGASSGFGSPQTSGFGSGSGSGGGFAAYAGGNAGGSGGGNGFAALAGSSSGGFGALASNNNNQSTFGSLASNNNNQSSFGGSGGFGNSQQDTKSPSFTQWR